MQTAPRAGGNFPPRRHTGLAAPADFPPRRRGHDDAQPPRTTCFLSPTFTSVAVAGLSGLVAAFSIAAAPATLAGELAIGLTVAAGTYLGSKTLKAVCGVTGQYGGAIAGGLTGALAGAAAGFLSRSDSPGAKKENPIGKNASLGLFAGAVAGSQTLLLAGSMAGFWVGAYLGHTVTKDAVIARIIPQETPPQPAAAPALPARAPAGP